MIISQPKTSFLGVVFDGDRDFEGPRAPKAHLDTVNTNILDHLAPPRTTISTSRKAGRAKKIDELQGTAPTWTAEHDAEHAIFKVKGTP